MRDRQENRDAGPAAHALSSRRGRRRPPPPAARRLAPPPNAATQRRPAVREPCAVKVNPGRVSWRTPGRGQRSPHAWRHPWMRSRRLPIGRARASRRAPAMSGRRSRGWQSADRHGLAWRWPQGGPGARRAGGGPRLRPNRWHVRHPWAARKHGARHARPFLGRLSILLSAWSANCRAKAARRWRCATIVPDREMAPRISGGERRYKRCFG